jgi:hypothetical protein
MPEAPTENLEITEYSPRTQELLTQFWMRESLRIALAYSEEDDASRHIEQEHAFVELLIHRIETECAKYPEQPVIVLFDIDRTIGSFDGDKMEFRPSIEPVLVLLNDKQHFPAVECGILTSRLAADLAVDLNSEASMTSIAPVAKYLNQDWAYSSGGGHGEAKVAMLDRLERKHPGVRFLLVEDTPPEQPDARIIDINKFAYDA